MNRLVSTVTIFLTSAVFGFSVGYIIVVHGLQPVIPSTEKLQFEFLEACRLGDIRRMEMLYAKGASINGFANNGYTEPSGPPLFETVDNLQPEATRWLLERGAITDLFIADGWTPIGSAEYARRRAETIVSLLKSHSPDDQN